MRGSAEERSAKLTPLGNTLEQVSEQAAGLTTRLDEITKRLSALADRTQVVSGLDKRIQTLKESAKKAEQTTQKALGTQATLDTLKKERATLEELRGRQQKAEAEVKQSLGQSPPSSSRSNTPWCRPIASTRWSGRWACRSAS